MGVWSVGTCDCMQVFDILFCLYCHCLSHDGSWEFIWCLIDNLICHSTQHRQHHYSSTPPQPIHSPQQDLYLESVNDNKISLIRLLMVNLFKTCVVDSIMTCCWPWLLTNSRLHKKMISSGYTIIVRLCNVIIGQFSTK